MKSSELLLKSLSGLLFLLFMMGIALFVTYGSLEYQLAWLYLIMFSCCVTGITVYLFRFDKQLLKSRLAAGPVAEQRLAQKIIQSIAGVSFLAVYILSALDYKHKLSNVPLYLSYAGELFCVIAFIFLFYVFKQNTFLSATIEVQEKQHVISTGLYGIVRHPMYTAAFLLLLFTPISLGSYYGLLPVLILIAVIIYRASDEEKELQQNLAGYKEYCQRVKYRFIPFVL
jgi:protein-S-isoprenylcysteine O-methyltransferase Ste14